jgi:hypothetical protein
MLSFSLRARLARSREDRTPAPSLWRVFVRVDELGDAAPSLCSECALPSYLPYGVSHTPHDHKKSGKENRGGLLVRQSGGAEGGGRKTFILPNPK